MTELFLVAHVVNAQSIETAMVELEVATVDPTGCWYTNEEHRIWPFWMKPIIIDIPSIPEGWLDYLHEEAGHFASINVAPKVDIKALFKKSDFVPNPEAFIKRRL